MLRYRHRYLTEFCIPPHRLWTNGGIEALDGGDERAVLNDRPSEFSRSFFIHHEILQRPGSRRLRRILQQTVTKKDRHRLHAPILLGSKFLPLGPSPSFTKRFRPARSLPSSRARPRVRPSRSWPSCRALTSGALLTFRAARHQSRLPVNGFSTRGRYQYGSLVTPAPSWIRRFSSTSRRHARLTCGRLKLSPKSISEMSSWVSLSLGYLRLMSASTLPSSSRSVNSTSFSMLCAKHNTEHGARMRRVDPHHFSN